MRRVVALWLSLAAVASVRPVAGSVPARGALGQFPSLVLWAWERPEDLRDLPVDTGVAFLAQTIVARGGELAIEPRRQPLRVRPATPLIAVTRIEIPPRVTLEDNAVAFITIAIVRTAALPRVSAVQIDFDALASQRNFYRDVIGSVRRALPPGTGLSVTALASWCQDDPWLAAMPIDEAVPMFFRMGPGVRRLDAPACPGAVGLSLDEPVDVQARNRRVYVFSPRRWTQASVDLARQLSR